jgi:FkbM family methyltransferase
VGATPPETRRKLQLELAMHEAPRDPAPRAAYFEHLAGLAAGHTGLLTALLPELGAPLYLRGGTPDIVALASVFRDRPPALETRATPARILVLGAYVGYTAVDLAHRFPRAEILAVEPLPDNARLLRLNTAMWRRVAVREVAVWHHRTRLAPTQRFQADWSVRLHDEEFDAYRTIPALGVQDLLDERGWRGAEMVVCDASGAERELFANPNAPWLDWLDIALVTTHDRLAPRAAEWVGKALPPDLFEHRALGAAALYLRRQPREAPAPAPAELALFRAEPGLTRFDLIDVMPAPHGFFVFNGGDCQLHPNPPGSKPAGVAVTLPAAGHRRFVAEVTHAGRLAAPIRFVASARRADGAPLGRAEVIARARERLPLRLEFAAPVSGPVTLELRTEMVPGSPDCANAWAHWLDPKLV